MCFCNDQPKIRKILRDPNRGPFFWRSLRNLGKFATLRTEDLFSFFLEITCVPKMMIVFKSRSAKNFPFLTGPHYRKGCHPWFRQYKSEIINWNSWNLKSFSFVVKKFLFQKSFIVSSLLDKAYGSCTGTLFDCVSELKSIIRNGFLGSWPENHSII